MTVPPSYMSMDSTGEMEKISIDEMRWEGGMEEYVIERALAATAK